MAKSKERFSRWTSIIATLSTTTLAVVSLLTVYITLSAWKDERESARPYFTFLETPSVNITETISINFQFKNVGNHPAINLWGKHIVIEEKLDEKPVLDKQYSLVNDIPKDTTFGLNINLDPEILNPRAESVNPHYIVITLHYDDPILNKSFKQTIYLKWNGKINKKIMPIDHIDVAVKESITKYLRRQKIDPHTKLESNIPLDHLDEQ